MYRERGRDVITVYIASSATVCIRVCVCLCMLISHGRDIAQCPFTEEEDLDSSGSPYFLANGRRPQGPPARSVWIAVETRPAVCCMAHIFSHYDLLCITACIGMCVGEITIAKATNVRQVVYFSEHSTLLNWEVNGSLFCTNYRICFVPDLDKVSE